MHGIIHDTNTGRGRTGVADITLTHKTGVLQGTRQQGGHAVAGVGHDFAVGTPWQGYSAGVGYDYVKLLNHILLPRIPLGGQPVAYANYIERLQCTYLYR